MGGKFSRTKGHAFERFVVRMFRTMGFSKAQRQLEYQEGFGVDIEHVGLFRPQCKKMKKYAPLSELEKIPVQKEKGEIPLLITAGDYKAPIVALYMDDFMRLCVNPNRERMTVCDKK